MPSPIQTAEDSEDLLHVCDLVLENVGAGLDVEGCHWMACVLAQPLENRAGVVIKAIAVE